MRLLLELHYDEVYRKQIAEQSGGQAARANTNKHGCPSSEYRLNEKVVRCFFNKRHEQMELPDEVKEVMESPVDEYSWKKLEDLRKAVLLTMEGARTVQLWEAATANQVAEAIHANEEGGHKGIAGALDAAETSIWTHN